MPEGLHSKDLLKPLDPQQQLLVEVIAEGFEANSMQWPVFDYIEGRLEHERIDPLVVLTSLPRHHGSGYGVAWWPLRGGAKPGPSEKIGLTVLGLSFAEELGKVNPGLVPAFFTLIRFLAEWRRRRSVSPGEPRDLRISSDLVAVALSERGIADTFLSGQLLLQLMEHEPATWQGGGSSSPDGNWERDIHSDVYGFESVRTIDAYIDATLEMLWQPPPPEPVTTPSPFGLVGAIDYLDTVWRLLPDHKGRHLFKLRRAQAIAALAFPVQSADEFDSRLSGLSDILRSAQIPNSASQGQRQRDRPLGPFESYLVSLLPEARPRIEAAIATLHRILDVRDAGQHAAAGGKRLTALRELGVGYPPPSWDFAWSVVTGRAIGALDAIREELSTLAD
jgi:hypothetical protein